MLTTALSDTNMPAPDLAKVLLTARLLRDAQLSGTTQPLLRGRRFALVCERDDDDSARLFHRSITELGGACTVVRPRLSIEDPPQSFKNTAEVLSRLYDAIECQGMPAELVSRLSAYASVPVYAGLATRAGIPASGLEISEVPLRPEDLQRYLVQAVLVNDLDRA